MSRFMKLVQTIWHCQYHIVWVSKYRFRILQGKIAREVANCIRAFSEQQYFQIIELNVQLDHVHLSLYLSFLKVFSGDTRGDLISSLIQIPSRNITLAKIVISHGDNSAICP